MTAANNESPMILEVIPGSVVVIRSLDAREREVDITGLHASMAAVVGHSDFLLLLLRPDDHVELLNVEAMAAAGWHRQPF